MTVPLGVETKLLEWGCVVLGDREDWIDPPNKEKKVWYFHKHLRRAREGPWKLREAKAYERRKRGLGAGAGGDGVWEVSDEGITDVCPTRKGTGGLLYAVISHVCDDTLLLWVWSGDQ